MRAVRGKGIDVEALLRLPPRQQANGTLYVGVTGDLANKAWQHRAGVFEGFTKKYGVHLLVWVEEYGDIADAIDRETQIKGRNRAWKIKLIEKENPDWADLYESIVR